MFLAMDFDNTLCLGYANEYVFRNLDRMPELLDLEALWKSEKISDMQLLTGIADLLKGLSVAELEEGVSGLKLSPHAVEFVSFAKAHSLPTVVVSQDYYEMIRPWCDKLGIDHTIGSKLKFSSGKITGAEKILSGPQDKLRELTSLAKEHGLGHEFIMVGDSTGDSSLFERASLSISVGAPIAQHNVSSLLETEKIITSFLEENK